MPQAPSDPVSVSPAIVEPTTILKLLVIDDDPSALELTRRTLTREGFAVATASGGAEGLRMARELQPAAILLDVQMPEVDGWHVMEALKADPTLAKIPVVMLTMVDDKSRGLAMGVADYLIKPAERTTLAAKLRQVAQPQDPTPAAPSDTLRAVVIEDDDANRRLLARLIRREGWEAIEAANGREALEKIGDVPPSLIMLDLTMPVMDGFAFLREIRSNPTFRNVPVLVLSARDLSDAERRDLNASVQQIIQKGAFSVGQLQTAIRDGIKLAGVGA